MKRWCTDIPQDPDGILSYVHYAKIQENFLWTEPILLSRLLGSLSSLATLWMCATKIPDELLGHIWRGEFGKGITTVHLRLPYCTLPTLTSMILSLPDLKKLCVERCGDVLEEPHPTYSVTPERGPLDSLKLYGCVDRIGEALTKFRFTSRRLSLDVGITNVEQLLLLSSETVVELKLYNTWSLWILGLSRDDNDRFSR